MTTEKISASDVFGQQKSASQSNMSCSNQTSHRSSQYAATPVSNNNDKMFSCYEYNDFFLPNSDTLNNNYYDLVRLGSSCEEDSTDQEESDKETALSLNIQTQKPFQNWSKFYSIDSGLVSDNDDTVIDSPKCKPHKMPATFKNPIIKQNQQAYRNSLFKKSFIENFKSSPGIVESFGQKRTDLLDLACDKNHKSSFFGASPARRFNFAPAKKKIFYRETNECNTPKIRESIENQGIQAACSIGMEEVTTTASTFKYHQSDDSIQTSCNYKQFNDAGGNVSSARKKTKVNNDISSRPDDFSVTHQNSFDHLASSRVVEIVNATIKRKLRVVQHVTDCEVSGKKIIQTHVEIIDTYHNAVLFAVHLDKPMPWDEQTDVHMFIFFAASITQVEPPAEMNLNLNFLLSSYLTTPEEFHSFFEYATSKISLSHYNPELRVYWWRCVGNGVIVVQNYQTGKLSVISNSELSINSGVQCVCKLLCTLEKLHPNHSFWIVERQYPQKKRLLNSLPEDEIVDCETIEELILNTWAANDNVTEYNSSFVCKDCQKPKFSYSIGIDCKVTGYFCKIQVHQLNESFFYAEKEKRNNKTNIFVCSEARRIPSLSIVNVRLIYLQTFWFLCKLFEIHKHNNISYSRRLTNKNFGYVKPLDKSFGKQSSFRIIPYSQRESRKPGSVNMKVNNLNASSLLTDTNSKKNFGFKTKNIMNENTSQSTNLSSKGETSNRESFESKVKLSSKIFELNKTAKTKVNQNNKKLVTDEVSESLIKYMRKETLNKKNNLNSDKISGARRKTIEPDKLLTYRPTNIPKSVCFVHRRSLPTFRE